MGPFATHSYPAHEWGHLIPHWTLPRVVTVPFGHHPEVSVSTPTAWVHLPPHTTWPPPPFLPPLSLHPLDTPTQWADQVREAKHLLRDGCQKIVLARRATYHGVPSDAIPGLLASLYHHSQGVYRLIMAHTHHHGMVSLSPEHLFRRQGRRIQLEALAGTRTNDQPAHTLDTPKNKLEHQVVCDWITQQLSPLIPSIAQGPQRVMQLSHVAHALTPFDIADCPLTDDQLIGHLFPTPAVGGFPRDKAVSYLLQHNQPAGSLYRGLMGLVCRDWSIWVVLIRYAEWHHHTWTLSAGAGIMPESDATEEWQEIEAKWKPYRHVFEPHLFSV